MKSVNNVLSLKSIESDDQIMISSLSIEIKDNSMGSVNVDMISTNEWITSINENE